LDFINDEANVDHLFAMKVFCQVIDSDGMASAARALGLGPATVTQTIAALEKRLDARLLNRTTRRIAITEAGRIYYGYAKRIIEEEAAADDAVRKSATEPSGLLRISLPLGVAQTFIYPQMPAFSIRYPQIQLDLQIDDDIVDLVENNFDLGLRVGYLDDAQWVAKPLLRYRRLTCASPVYLARYGKPQHPGDLASHNCLLYRHAIGAVRWEYLIGGEIVRVAVNGTLCSNESNALLNWARNGQGITRQPDWLVNEDIKAGRLLTILDDFVVRAEASLPGIYVVLPRRQYQAAKVNAFIEFFAEKIMLAGSV
jgi:LysR family transcriptional regulator, transcriptional activator for dmlA